jgi:hypothetical protein
MLDMDISQEDARMPVLARLFPTTPPAWPTARGLCTLLALLALAGCSARPLHEQQPPSLPGGGTYTWEAGGIEPLPGVATPQESRMNPDSIRAAIDNGLTNRGYEPRPEGEATWRVSYRSIQQTRDEKLVPNDRLLEPRLSCDRHDCRVTHQFVHFGPPLYAENPVIAVKEDIVQVQIHDMKSGHLIWQGYVATEPDAEGRPDEETMRKKINKLMRQLPGVRPRTAKADTTPAAAAPQ